MAILTHPDACEPWGYVAPSVAAVMTRATGVRHIYLIAIVKKSSIHPLLFTESLFSLVYPPSVLRGGFHNLGIEEYRSL